MADKDNHEDVQDARIRRNESRIIANQEAIRKQLAYLDELLTFFKPWRASRWDWYRTFRGKYYGRLLKLFALITLYTGLFKTVQWYINFQQISRMADRYVEVANRMYYEEGNPDVAITFLDKAIKLRDGKAEYRFLRAYIDGLASTRLLFNLGRPFTKTELDTVHRSLAEAVFLQELEPKRAEPYLLQGQILTALKEYDRAEAALRKAVALAPENDFVHVRLGALQLEKKEVDSADRELAEALRLNPRSKWAWLWKGVLANDHRQSPEEARACYGKALEIDPKFDMALYNMGWTWVTGKKRDYAKARQFMLDALRVNPAYKEACYAIGMFYGYEDNYAVAKVWLDKAIALDAGFLDAWKMRGVVKGEMGDFAGAVADLDGAIRLDPMNADLYVRRAKMSSSLGKVDNAIRDLTFACDLNPEAKRAWLYFGDIYSRAGDMEKAVVAYDRAIAIDGSYAEAFAGKAMAMAAKGDKKAAIELLDKAIAVAKYKPERFVRQKEELLEKTANGAKKNDGTTTP